MKERTLRVRMGIILWMLQHENNPARTRRILICCSMWLQRATLAEKEVSALKEQLAAANDGNSKTEGHKLSQTPQGSDQQVHDASNPRRTPNSNLEQELQAKDKEVRESLVSSPFSKSKYAKFTANDCNSRSTVENTRATVLKNCKKKKKKKKTRLMARPEFTRSETDDCQSSVENDRRASRIRRVFNG